jgi:hypothetical protein
MDTFGGPSSDYDYQMETTEGHHVTEGGSAGNLGLNNLDEAGTRRPTTPTPSSIADQGRTTMDRPMQEVDNAGDIHTLSHRATGCAHVTVPNVFDRSKENYRRFRRQLFLTTNHADFKEGESMIWFTLSYMKGGAVELWANSYVDKALEDNDWGMWEEFLDQLAKDFSHADESRKALEEMGKLAQGKKTAAEYFLHLEQLASVAGIDINRYPNTLLYVKKNMQHMLIDQLYQSDTPPKNYQDYKRRIVAMDEMRQ